MDWLDLLAVPGILKSLLQHHNSKASILPCSVFFTVQLLHAYLTTGKTIALTRWTFVGKVMSLLFNMLSRLVIIFLPRSKHLYTLYILYKVAFRQVWLLCGSLYFFNLLEHSCFTMLYQFLLYCKVNQLYIYIYPLPFGLPTHLGHYSVLSRAPCARHYVLISYLFCTKHQWCVCDNPNHPIPPAPLNFF